MSEDDLRADAATPALRDMLAELVDWAESLLLAGLPLVAIVPRPLGVDVDLFVRGGLAVLAEIRRAGYDVLFRRATVSRLAKVRLVAGSWWRNR